MINKNREINSTDQEIPDKNHKIDNIKKRKNINKIGKTQLLIILFLG